MNSLLATAVSDGRFTKHKTQHATGINGQKDSMCAA